MKTTLFCLSLAAVTAVCACGSDDEDGGKELMSATGPWTVYPQTGGAANPAQNITGNAKAIETSPGKMRVELNVMGVEANHAFGAHLHKLACDDTMAGGHYQHTPSTTTPNDPMFANNTNEAWMDFTADAGGKGAAKAEVAWVPAAGAAKSIVVHVMPTGAGGVAGAKLACLPVTFK
jgi:hypothetical protein